MNQPQFSSRAGRLFAALAFLGLSVAVACGDGADASEDKGLCSGPDCQPPVGTDPCSGPLKGKCGVSCSATKACDAGLYCGSDGKCTAQCLAGKPNQCGSGAHCSSDGRCVLGPDLGGGLGGASNGGGGDAGAGNCIDVDVDFTPQTPTVMLLVDRSGSMNGDSQFEDAPAWDCRARDNDWRWNVARYVLLHPTEGVVKPLEDKVRFGQVLYSARETRETCPTLTGVVTPALNNHDAMLQEFPCSDIDDDTPTRESLAAAVEQLAAFNEPGPKIIVLATDGEPDSCQYYDWERQSSWEAQGIRDRAHSNEIGAEIKASVVAEAAAARAKDITVHTIHIAENNGTLWQHIQDVAEAGGGQAFAAYSVEELKDAFQNIVDGSRSCKIDLSGSIEKGKESQGRVTLDGGVLELDDKDGWRVNNSSQIELLGEACETIKVGEHVLDIKFPCGTFSPIK